MPLHTLAPDQRAVVQLVLQRERSYGQIAELLSISEDAVRARAHAGLSALAPDVELPADKRAQVADFLLGQQTGKPRQATRRMLRRSNGARAWAETGMGMYVKIWLPEQDWLTLRATVLYQMEKIGFGLRFDAVTPEDVQHVAHDCLRHRVSLTYEASADGKRADDVIDELIRQVAVAI